MINKHLLRALVSDPFPDTTRAKRRSLLAASTIGIAVVRGGLLPDKLPFIGLESIGIKEQRVLLVLLFALVAYYLLAFILYVGRDCLNMLALYHGGVDQDLVNPQATANESQLRAIQNSQRFWEAKTGLRRTAWLLAIPRWGLEVAFPVSLGVYAVSVLWP